MLEKSYEPKKYEDEIYKKWEESGLFNPDVCDEKGAVKNDRFFSMVLPPPNVTGTLHMGHAAMLAIEDVMTRYHRMKGDRTLWLPGTDHAAIATQTKVEKLLMEKGMKDPKIELGREKFLQEVDKFAKQSHDTIVNQCKKMGSSLDWSREAFTLDEKRSLAVRTVFKKMYDDGLIERGYRIVNWCPRCHSTLADDEVEYKEQKAKLYTFIYGKCSDGKDFPIPISTTRPETKLGDTAVAVNPKDKRYKKYIGKTFEIKNFASGPDLKIRVIGDEAVDMKFGTGAVGVTPAHSFVDYEMAQKNDLPIIKVVDEDGKMTKESGKEFFSLTVKEARKKVVEFLQKNKLLKKEEDTPNNLSICYRCGAAIEPLPSKQWFIRVDKEFKIGESRIKGIKKGEKITLKKLMQAAVKNQQIEIIPDRFVKTYFHWIDNLRDWCISRQIWYGHRIPVWYGKNKKDGEIHVDVNPPKDEDSWKQDPDTLDTWFSSGLWTFSTLGWPEKGEDFKNFHPTSMLETGYDILFFWVARMILMSAYILGEIPFEKVYLHGLVRDEQGRKMSKSLGNVIDPLSMIEKYGADATRLSLLIGNTPGNDMKLSEEKIAGFRNFTNKLWNIARFIILNIQNPKIDTPVPKSVSEADKWILKQLDIVIGLTQTRLANFQFSLAGEKLRDFTWGELADWYLETAKIEGEKSEILNYILNTILKLWHPFMPFVTEAIWRELYGEDKTLMVETWPQAGDPDNLAELINFEFIKDIISEIRTIRMEKGIEPAKKISVTVSAGKNEKLLKENMEVIKGLARLEKLQIEKKAEKPASCIGLVVGTCELFVDLSGVIDVGKEKSRLEAEIKALEGYQAGLNKKMENKEFVKNAPAEIVEKEKQKLIEVEEKLKKLKEQYASLH